MAEELELNSTQVEHEYGGSEIQVLEGLEAVRKRPGMYIGSTSESGLHHLVYEIVDNSIDEALAGHCTDITVTINPGNTITVTDNGRGIPVDIQPQTGKPALEVVFTILHAGGKFGGGGYKVSGGLHGVGASVVNALSEWLEVQVHKNGQIYEMKFSRGKITQEMKVVGRTDHTGTTVTFKPDPEMFDTLVYSYETLHTRMREEAFLNAGLRIQTVDLRPGQEQEDDMCYEGGIREFVTFLNKSKDPLHSDVIYMSGAREDSMAEVAMQYNDGYSEVMVSFANNVHTPEGGMDIDSFKLHFQGFGPLTGEDFFTLVQIVLDHLGDGFIIRQVSDDTGHIRISGKLAGFLAAVAGHDRGDGQDFILLNADIERRGMIDGNGIQVVRFPDDGHPTMCAEAVNLYGDARDEIVTWDYDSMYIYTQDDAPKDDVYTPFKYPDYNASNYRGEYSYREKWW